MLEWWQGEERCAAQRRSGASRRAASAVNGSVAHRTLTSSNTSNNSISNNQTISSPAAWTSAFYQSSPQQPVFSLGRIGMSRYSMDIERLIEEVEKRPILYDCRIAGYSRKELKPKLWQEVAREITPSWAAMNPVQRGMRVQEAQKRWRTLRDNFKRELNYQRCVESGQIPPTKRKKYTYYDLLQFLVPIMDRGRIKQEVVTNFKSEVGELGDAITIYKRDTEEVVPYPLLFMGGGGGGDHEGRGSEGSGAADYEEPSGQMMEAEDGEGEGEAEGEGEMDQSAVLDDRGVFPPLPLPPPHDPAEMFLLSLAPALRALSPAGQALARVRLTQAMYELGFPEQSTAGPAAHSHSVGPIVIHCRGAGGGAEPAGPPGPASATPAANGLGLGLGQDSGDADAGDAASPKSNDSS